MSIQRPLFMWTGPLGITRVQVAAGRWSLKRLPVAHRRASIWLRLPLLRRLLQPRTRILPSLLRILVPGLLLLLHGRLLLSGRGCSVSGADLRCSRASGRTDTIGSGCCLGLPCWLLRWLLLC